jgi:hypothetical protein
MIIDWQRLVEGGKTCPRCVDTGDEVRNAAKTPEQVLAPMDIKDGLWSYYQLRPVEDGLAKRHLEVLRTTLAKREDAAPLLAKLHAWLQAKSRRAAKDGACATAPPMRAAPRSRAAQLAGGSR